MRKIVLALVLLLVMAMPVMASDLPSTDFGTNGTINAGLEIWSIGTFYNAEGKEVLGDFQVDILDYKRLVGLYAGFVTDSKSSPFTLGLGLDFNTLASMFRLNYNIPGGLHLIGFIARDVKKSWKAGGLWGYKLVKPF